LPVDGFFCQSAIACTSSVETVKPPSSKRSMFSSRTFRLNGSFETSPIFSAALAKE